MASTLAEPCAVCTDAVARVLPSCGHYVHRRCVLMSGKQECPLCKMDIGNITRGERRILNTAARSLESYNRENSNQLVRDAIEAGDMEISDDEDDIGDDETAMFNFVINSLGMHGFPRIISGFRPHCREYEVQSLDVSSVLHRIMLQPGVANNLFNTVDKPVYVNGLINGMQVIFMPDSMRAAVRTHPSVTVDLVDAEGEDHDIDVVEDVQEEEDEDGVPGSSNF